MIDKKEVTLKNYLNEVNSQIESIYEEDMDKDELKELIELIKLDYDNDFCESFKNQIYNLIKSDEYQNFFDFKSKDDISIINYIYNYAKIRKTLIQEEIKKKENKDNDNKSKDVMKNINNNPLNMIIDKNNEKKTSKDNIQNNSNTSSLKSESSKKNSSLYFSIDISNLINNNFSINESSIKENENDKSVEYPYKDEQNQPIDSKSGNKLGKNKKYKKQKNLNEKIKEEKKEVLVEEYENKEIQNESLGEKEGKSDEIEPKDKKENEKDTEGKKIDFKAVTKKDIKENITQKIKGEEEDKENKEIEENKLFLRKDFKFDDYEGKKKEVEPTKKIKYYDDISKIKGASFEYDVINYIFMQLYSCSIHKDFFIIYDFSPDIDKINRLFKKHKLYELNKIQFDFIAKDLKITELIKFLINIYQGIHPNSKISFIKDNSFFDLEDLNKLKEEFTEERIDIIGEIGVNIFNEEEKCEQLLKYSKLIHNINCLKRQNDEDLPFLLDLLNLKNDNKKLLLFITDGSFLYFKNSKNCKFLKMQKVLSFDTLLVYKNKNSLFRTAFLEKLFKKYKKEQKILFNDDLSKSYEKIMMKYPLESNLYQKVFQGLSIIEKKMNYIRSDLYNFFKTKSDFLKICNEIMKTIEYNEINKISIDYIKNENKLNEFVESKKVLKKKVYIIFDRYNEKKKKDCISKLNKYDNITITSGEDLNIIREKERNIRKIIILLIRGKFFDSVNKISAFKNLIENFQINKFNQIIFYIENDEAKQYYNFYQNIFKLNFEYITNIAELDNLINSIQTKYDKIDAYNNYLIEERKYKFLIKEYIELFNKSIFCKQKKEKYTKNELLFTKLIQDIQFFETFDYNENICLKEDTKNEILNIVNDKNIKKLIDIFIDESKILNEIEKILLNFEDSIDKQLKEKKVFNSKENEGNEKEESININTKANNRNDSSNEENEININDNNEKEELNIEEIKDSSLERIEKCEQILKDKKKRKEIEPQKGKHYKFFVLKNLIKENIEEKIKNEILNITYIILQKSIIHLYEIKFLEEFY